MLKPAAASFALAAAGLIAAASLHARVDETVVTVADRAADRRVDISIGGRPFTSYIYPTSLEKPVLYPIRSAGGALVTRGYPLEPKPGERADHPHHVGHWFNYGDVNGYDFWGHSFETPAANLAKTGSIVHKAIARIITGKSQGELTVSADWVVPGSTLMREETRFIFSGAARTTGDRSDHDLDGRRQGGRRSTIRRRARSASGSRARSSNRPPKERHSSAPTARKKPRPVWTTRV